MRRLLFRRTIAFFLGAALFLSAAPGFLCAAPRQKKSSPGKAKAAAQAPASKKSRGKASKKSARQRAQKSPTPDRIREIQQALAKSGHYQGEPTGKMDAQTVASIKAFQEANGFPATGKLDARSLQKLGLGSFIAGVGAPRPAANSATPPRR